MVYLFSITLYKIYLPNFIIKHTYKIILIFCFVDYFLIFPFLNTVLTRRIFFLPGLISEKYHTYFNENGFTYFSDLPFFEFFSLNPFTHSIPETIGRYFIYGEGYMNAGFLADAYSKLGLLSVILLFSFLNYLFLFRRVIEIIRKIYYFLFSCHSFYFIIKFKPNNYFIFSWITSCIIRIISNKESMKYSLFIGRCRIWYDGHRWLIDQC